MGEGLEPCNACGKTVSKNAEVCPYCEEPQPTFTFTEFFGNALGWLISFIVAYYIIDKEFPNFFT